LIEVKLRMVEDPLKPSVALPDGRITAQIKPPIKANQPLTNELKKRVEGRLGRHHIHIGSRI
jgi:hypothetical protein